MADALKSGVAAGVQRGLVSGAFAAEARKTGFGDAINPANIVDIDVHAVDQLNTQIRVRLHRGGVRYFNIKVSEPW